MVNMIWLILDGLYCMARIILPILKGSYYMTYIIWQILYCPYEMSQMIWLIYMFMNNGCEIWFGINSACNLDLTRDFICNLFKGTLYACNIENRLKITWLWFLDESRENKFSMFASIFGPHLKRLQVYMVRFGFEIAGIFSPLWNLDCIHIRSPL